MTILADDIHQSFGGQDFFWGGKNGESFEIFIGSNDTEMRSHRSAFAGPESINVSRIVTPKTKQTHVDDRRQRRELTTVGMDKSRAIREYNSSERRPESSGESKQRVIGGRIHRLLE